MVVKNPEIFNPKVDPKFDDYLFFYRSDSDSEWVFFHTKTLIHKVGVLTKAATQLREKYPNDASYSPKVVENKHELNDWRNHSVGSIGAVFECTHETQQVQGQTEGNVANKPSSRSLKKPFEHVLDQAVIQNASDIHISRGSAKAVISFRINGLLIEQELIDPAEADVMVGALFNLNARGSTNNEASWTNHRPIDTEIKMTALKKSVVLRFQQVCNREENGWDVALRLLVEQSSSVINKLGYEKHQEDNINRAVRRPHGLVIISGPTGSGKTTSLAEILKHLNYYHKGTKRILTLEDPPEIPIPGVKQLRLHNDPKYKSPFSEGIKNCMRMDPDALMIGEIRDIYTAQALTEVVLTGHKVFSTTHANGAIATAARLIDLGIEPNILAMKDFLSIIIHQVLLPTYDEDNKQYIKKVADINFETYPNFSNWLYEKTKSTDEVETFLSNNMFFVPYKNASPSGRKICAEVLIPGDAMLKEIFDKNYYLAEKIWIENGGKTMAMRAIELAAIGVISLDDLEGRL